MRDRRGVLLLVALVLLVLFLLLGVTFVLMASNFRRSSEAYRRLQEGGDATAQAGDLLHGVARDLVRGTHNPESPFSKENLLEDMYGQPALRGKVKIGTTPSVAPNTGGQFTELTIDADADFPNFGTATEPDGYYSGLVLTIITGEAAHQSTRIVDFDSSSNTLTVMTKGDISVAGLADGDLILVNGRPFSGDGTGHATGATTRRLNEDYDAADLNNPWLAAGSTNDTDGDGVAELVASWENSFVWGSDSTNRPIKNTLDDDGVDNDGDGAKDSIWIDAGLPLQTQSDGTLVKPLVAMLVRDLDGRVNVNAHGSADQQAALSIPTASDPIGQGYGPAEIDPSFVLGYSSPGQATDVLTARHGSDSFPGDSGDDPLSAVSQFHHYGGDLNAFVTPHDIDGTSKAVVGATGQIEFQDASGNTFTSGATNFQDDPYEMQLDTALVAAPDDSPFTPAELEAVFRHRDVDAGSLPDRLQEALTVGVADADKPAEYDSLRDLVTTESWDLPVHPVALPEEVYGEIDTWINNYITAIKSTSPPPPTAEVERQEALLRELLLSPGHITDLFIARSFVVTPDNLAGTRVQDIIDRAQWTDFDAELATLKTFFSSQMGATLFPVIDRDREMRSGLKFNVNRLFGNGKDDDGNGVVDEPGEAGTSGTAPAYGSSETDLLPAGTVRGQFTGVDFDHNGDGTIDADDKQARQQYAQQLYLLLMLCADMRESGTDGLQNDGVGSPNAVVPAPTGILLADGQDRRRLLARRLAQFAVNAVDYRDADSIMTGFEYDANPFDGWDVDGNLSTDESNDSVDNDGDGSTDETDGSEDPGTDPDRGVVWGTEDPVLYLTETYAMHDRRVRDVNEAVPSPPSGTPLATDLTNTTRKVDTTATQTNLQPVLQASYPSPNSFPPSGELPQQDINAFFDQSVVVFEDDDFDQYAKPEGSLFVELYHAHANPKADPASFASRQDIYTASGEVDLGRTNPGGSPVWRLAISAPHPTGPDLTSTPAIDETLAAGPGSPVFNQLADVDSSGGELSPGEATGASGGFWSSAVTQQPGLAIPKDPSSIPSSPTAKDLTAANKFTLLERVDSSGNVVTSPPGDSAIQIDRLVYFAPAGSIAAHASLVRDAMRERNILGSMIDPNWDGIYCASSASPLAEGAYAVVGPRAFTPFGRAADSDGDGQKEDTASPEGINLGANGIVCTAESDLEIPLSISEPLPQSTHSTYYQKNDDPYDPNSKYTTILSTPLDNSQDWIQRLAVMRSLYSPQSAPVAAGVLNRPAVAITDLQVSDTSSTSYTYDLKVGGADRNPFAAHFSPGTITQYCTVFLQRLANPLEAWNPETNPYISVDAMPVDLTVFNGDDDTPDPINLTGAQASTEGNLVSPGGEFVTPTVNTSRQRGTASNLLFPVAGTLPPGSLSPGATTLGAANFGSPPSPAPFWPNRPFVSGYELLMVPASEPGKLSFELGTHNGGTPQTNFGDGFPHLLNFFYEDSSTNVPRLGRLFDYLHVPSRYAGTQTTLRPDNFQANTDGFAPPFNRISNYREPGRVNLNTIEPNQISPVVAWVWESVMHGDPDPAGSSPPGPGSKTHPGATYANIQSQLSGGDKPFRSSSYAELNGEPLPPAQPSLLTASGSSPMFAGDLSGPPPPERDFDKNPFLRYGPINRLGNLVGTRSNVYAVWMTLGYFEVDPTTGAVASPPVEAGENTGEIERHRAFYMIDRTIPVGYENGQDHNTDDVFRVQRFIE